MQNGFWVHPIWMPFIALDQIVGQNNGIVLDDCIRTALKIYILYICVPFIKLLIQIQNKFGSQWTTLLLLACCISFLVYVFRNYIRQVHLALSLRGPKTIPLIGNALIMSNKDGEQRRLYHSLISGSPVSPL